MIEPALPSDQLPDQVDPEPARWLDAPQCPAGCPDPWHQRQHFHEQINELRREILKRVRDTGNGTLYVQCPGCRNWIEVEITMAFRCQKARSWGSASASGPAP